MPCNLHLASCIELIHPLPLPGGEPFQSTVIASTTQAVQSNPLLDQLLVFYPFWCGIGDSLLIILLIV
jgi:hypothetical protein